MIFSLIGMKFHGKFLEANNLYFGKHPQHGGGGSGVSLETGAFFFFFFSCQWKEMVACFHWMPALSCFEKIKKKTAGFKNI